MWMFQIGINKIFFVHDSFTNSSVIKNENLKKNKSSRWQLEKHIKNAKQPVCCVFIKNLVQIINWLILVQRNYKM